MEYLNAVDYTVMGIYVCCLVALSLYLTKRASASLEDYFLGGKKLPWWALGISGMASFLDITGTMLIVSFLYMIGPRGLFIEFRGGAVLILTFMLLWTGKWHRRSNCMTAAEWNIYRFGAGREGHVARVVTAAASVIWPIGMIAYMFKGVGPFFATFLPLSPTVCAIGLISIAALYTMISGFYGVVFTDLFQSGIILIAVIAISVMAIRQVPDVETVATVAREVTGNADWISPVPHVHTPMPRGYEQYEALAMFMLFYLMKNFVGGFGSGGDPKYFGARNERECGVLSFFWTWLMMFRWPMMMGFVVLGLFLVREQFPDQAVLQQTEFKIKRYLVAQKHPGATLDLEAGAYVTDTLRGRGWVTDLKATLAIATPDQVEALRNGLGSDLDKTLLRLVAEQKMIDEVAPKPRWGDITARIGNRPDAFPGLVDDIQATLGKKQWKEKLKMVSFDGTIDPERILPSVLLFDIPMGLRGLLLVALLAASMSTFDSNINMATGFFTRDIYQGYLRPRASNRELINASYGCIVVMVLLGFALGYTTESINDIWEWIIMSLTAGLAVPGVLRFYWWRFNAWGVIGSTVVGLVATVIQRIGWPAMDGRVQFAVMTLLSLAGAVVATYLTPPTDERVLEHFYKTTRPFGWWGRFKDLLPPEKRRAVTREHVCDLCAVPFALLWQITLFLLPMLAIIRNWPAFRVTAVIFVVSLIGMYFLWYRNLPPARDGVPDGGDLDYVKSLFKKPS